MPKYPQLKNAKNSKNCTSPNSYAQFYTAMRKKTQNTWGCSNMAKCTSVSTVTVNWLSVVNKVQQPVLSTSCNSCTGLTTPVVWHKSRKSHCSNTVKCKSRSLDPRLGVTLGCWKDPIEFLGFGFLVVFNSNCRPTMHNLATIHERDQPTTPWHDLLQTAPLTTGVMHKNQPAVPKTWPH